MITSTKFSNRVKYLILILMYKHCQFLETSLMCCSLECLTFSVYKHLFLVKVSCHFQNKHSLYILIFRLDYS